ncbi:jg22128 [Pararge aegeria aegeria]|uniref:Jg22128 protein n=1 Tax=Pararge aegeria aegeria TaxID=348720 RepID=A0A8S4QWE5_9NEOP|nr:jg22128 [Pararge aegeria aegeria]
MLLGCSDEHELSLTGYPVGYPVRTLRDCVLVNLFFFGWTLADYHLRGCYGVTGGARRARELAMRRAPGLDDIRGRWETSTRGCLLFLGSVRRKFDCPCSSMPNPYLI